MLDGLKSLFSDAMTATKSEDAKRQLFLRHLKLIHDIQHYNLLLNICEDVINTSCPNDAKYISPLHAAILKNNTWYKTNLLKNYAPYIIYHATPEIRHDLLKVAIENKDEKTALAIFEYGVNNNKTNDKIDDMACMIVDQGSRKLTEIAQYLKPAINKNMPNLAKRILEELPKEELNEQFLLDCLNEALGRGYLDVAKIFILELPQKMVFEFIQQHIQIIPDEFIILLFGDYFDNALRSKAFFELLLRNNKIDAAMTLFDYFEVSEPQLIALINGNVPLSEKLLEKAIEKNMRGAVRLLINKGCPGREHALERCIHHSQENLACELIHDGHGFHLHTLWVQAFKKSQFHVLKSMIRHGLDLNTISSLNWNKVQPNDNILIASLRYGKWDLMIEILKRKPPINYVQEAFDSVKLNYQANDPALNELIEAIKSLSQDEDMTPYLEIILSAINETSPEAVCLVGNVLYDAHLPQLAYPLLKDVPFSEKMREQYQKAQSACAHIVLNNCEQNESRENKERRIDATVEHLLEAKDKDLIKFLYKDLYKHQKQAEVQAQAPMPAPAQGSKQGSKPGSGGFK